MKSCIQMDSRRQSRCFQAFYTLVAFILVLIIPPSLSNENEGFRDIGLRFHNQFRQRNNAPPLQMDQELNKMAHAHAEKLAELNSLTPSEVGYEENLWSFRGELLPLAKDLEYAIKNWYTGSKVPGRVQSSVNPFVLRSDSVQHVGFGVGTSEKTGEGYTVVVAFYS